MESNNTHISTIAVGAAVVFFFCVIRKLRCIWIQSQFAKVHGCEPVLPASKDPLLGIDVLLENIQAAKSHRFLELIQHRFQRYGNTFRVKRFTTPFIITCEPANLKNVLSLKFRDYGLGSRIATFGPLLGHGIFTSDGEHWAQSRAMVRPSFVKDQIADLEKLEELMQCLLALIPTDGSTVDLQDFFFCYTLDSATEFLFGHSVQSLNQRLSGVVPDDSDFASAFNYAQHAIARNTRLGFLGRVIPDHKATRSNRICHSLVEQLLLLLLLIHTLTPRLSDMQGTTISTLYVHPFLVDYYFPDELGASSRPVVASAWGCVLPPSWRATSESLRCLRKVQDRPEDATVLRTILEPTLPTLSCSSQHI
ncbi:uncharacterized protein AKAW2_40223A [Aspergillus luchuensis]|uniref:Cytochrome P450 alkane hydroxylase n=1 Tax=Aspergillus kawachii TaxID=1069201 RepID=A0A7R7ZXX3_ASPKA|nr:uncharacterized protein AKAW2_40223A [Aspergillus luchuensis]BCR98540.1 hypothetical protein AKAW2_40223A [Aspergillus luchuensis]